MYNRYLVFIIIIFSPSLCFATMSSVETGCKYKTLFLYGTGSTQRGSGNDTVTFSCDGTYTTSPPYVVNALYSKSSTVYNYTCTNDGWSFINSSNGSTTPTTVYNGYAETFNYSPPSVDTVKNTLLPYCSTCLDKRQIWGNSNCFNETMMGDASLVLTYDCATNTGTCDATCTDKQTNWVSVNCSDEFDVLESFDCATNNGVCFNCPESRMAWTDQNCSAPGEVVQSYDCQSKVGDCLTCDEKRDAWGSANCLDSALIGDPSLVLSYDCVADTGTCDLACDAKQANWETANCTNGQVLESFDCATNTGTCGLSCESKQSAWATANCTDGQTLDTYDCASNTGTCKSVSAECQTAQSNWISTYCSAEQDTFVSFDCSTGHGVCQHGSDFTYTPTDEEKSLYTNRFNKFIDDMRHTPLFSLPDQVLGNIPSGGDPVYTVQMGQYGSVDIDLSNYNSLFAICRTIFLVCFSFAALRILLSHR